MLSCSALCVWAEVSLGGGRGGGCTTVRLSHIKFKRKAVCTASDSEIDRLASFGASLFNLEHRARHAAQMLNHRFMKFDQWSQPVNFTVPSCLCIVYGDTQHHVKFQPLCAHHAYALTTHSLFFDSMHNQRVYFYAAACIIHWSNVQLAWQEIHFQASVWTVRLEHHANCLEETRQGRMRERERGRETDRQTDRETDRQTDRQRGRVTDIRYRLFSHTLWPWKQVQLRATLINYILIPLDLKAIVHAHALCIDMIPSDPGVSKCNQSRWPSHWFPWSPRYEKLVYYSVI